jgi:hypothetical protein
MIFVITALRRTNRGFQMSWQQRNSVIPLKLRKIEVLSFILLIPDNTRLSTALNSLMLLKMIPLKTFYINRFLIHLLCYFQSLYTIFPVNDAGVFIPLLCCTYTQRVTGIPPFTHDNKRTLLWRSRHRHHKYPPDDGLFRFHCVSAAVALMQKPFYTL